MKLSLKERKLVKEYAKKLASKNSKNLNEGITSIKTADWENATNLWRQMSKALIPLMQKHLNDDSGYTDGLIESTPAMDCALILHDLYSAGLDVSIIGVRILDKIVKKLEQDVKNPDLDKSFKMTILKLIKILNSEG